MKIKNPFIKYIMTSIVSGFGGRVPDPAHGVGCSWGSWYYIPCCNELYKFKK